MAREITDANFKNEVLDFDGVTLIDFWAEWCTPCKALAPIIENLSAKHANNPKIKIAKLDVDNNQAGNQYNVFSIPTMILFKGGQEAKRIVGLRSEADIERELLALAG